MALRIETAVLGDVAATIGAATRDPRQHFHDRPVGRLAEVLPIAFCRPALWSSRTDASRRSVPIRRRADIPPLLSRPLHRSGFIDVRHGVDGVDASTRCRTVRTVAAIAASLPRYGVTAFCPTTMACGPEARDPSSIRCRRAQTRQRDRRACCPRIWKRYIGQMLRGAQPAACCAAAGCAWGGGGPGAGGDERSATALAERSDFSAADILAEIERATPDVRHRDDRVRAGGRARSGAVRCRHADIACRSGHIRARPYEAKPSPRSRPARCHATHLFNRIPPLVIARRDSPAQCCRPTRSRRKSSATAFDVPPRAHPDGDRRQTALADLRITDATAASGLPAGSRAMLGGRRRSTAGASTARAPPDSTIAGSVLT